MAKIALYQPDIAGNVGTIIRLCACLGFDLDIIEPCGFPWNARKVRQSALDYYDSVNITRHQDWESFKKVYAGRRIILLTTKTDKRWTDIEYTDNDILLAGSESKGVPDFVHNGVDEAITIPMQSGQRSLNIATAISFVSGEFIRQTSL